MVEESKYGNVSRTLTKKVEGDQKDNKFTVPLKSKLPVASLFLRDENRVARITDAVMYRSNRSFNMPPRAYPGHLTSLPSRGGGNLIIRVFQGVGNLIPML